MATQCPKCHEFVEEDYVCCANIEFQWVCQSCHKRSRGFALPFGQCPLCGGHLQQDLPEDHPSQASITALQEAMQIELNAYHYYQRLAAATQDSKRKNFFQNISEMEREHAEELSTKYHLNLGEIAFRKTSHPMPKSFQDSLHAFNKTGDLKALYNCAIDFEKKGHDFFSKKATELSKGKERDLYLELAAEEEEHIALLETERDR